MTNQGTYRIDYEAHGNQLGRGYRAAKFKTRYAAEKAIHRLEGAPESWRNIRRHYPAPTYPDESWYGGWNDIGMVGVGTFAYDDLARQFDPCPIRVMVEDDEGLAEAYLTVEAAEKVYERLGQAIQRVKDAQQQPVTR